MEKIIIENFGPVKYFESEIKDLMFFIGPQASGKSTICKLIYFFYSLFRNFDISLVKILPNKFAKISNFYDYFVSMIKEIFIKMFYDIKCYNNCNVIFFYKKFSLNLRIKNNEIEIRIDKNFKDSIEDIEKRIRFLYEVLIMGKENIHELNSRIEIEKELNYIFYEINEKLKELFLTNYSVLFIPAGRNLISIISEQLERLNIDNIEYSIKNFLEQIKNLKFLFNNFIDNYKIVGLISKILKGKYKFEDDIDKLYFTENNFIKMQYASSGQQEILWLLLLVYLNITPNSEKTLIIEEPEAHLYPSSQKDVVELLALSLNKGQNKVIISTHSPYILTSANNLIYANNVGQKKPEETAKIIDKDLWLDVNRVAAFMLENGEATNIIDNELNLIKAEEIDRVSKEINENFDKLFQLDD